MNGSVHPVSQSLWLRVDFPPPRPRAKTANRGRPSRANAPLTFLTPFGGMGGARRPVASAAVGDVPQGALAGGRRAGGRRAERVLIGLQCVSEAGTAVPPRLLTTRGILVEAIIDKSPAAKAGIQKYDVLTRAGDKKLTKVQDLIDAVDAVKEGLLKVELVRGKEKKTVEVTPEKRPPIEPPGPDAAALWGMAEVLRLHEAVGVARAAARRCLRFWHPGDHHRRRAGRWGHEQVAEERDDQDSERRGEAGRGHRHPQGSDVERQGRRPGGIARRSSSLR